MAVTSKSQLLLRRQEDNPPLKIQTVKIVRKLSSAGLRKDAVEAESLKRRPLKPVRSGLEGTFVNGSAM